MRATPSRHKDGSGSRHCDRSHNDNVNVTPINHKWKTGETPTTRSRGCTTGKPQLQAQASHDASWWRRKAHQNGPHPRSKDAFPRFGAFQRKQIRESLCDGLPHRHLPLTGFLTLSAASSSRTLAALFRAASAHRLRDLKELFRQSQRRRLSTSHTLLPLDTAPESQPRGRGNTTLWQQSSNSTLATEHCSGLTFDTSGSGRPLLEATALLAFVLSKVQPSNKVGPQGTYPQALESSHDAVSCPQTPHVDPVPQGVLPIR